MRVAPLHVKKCHFVMSSLEALHVLFLAEWLMSGIVVWFVVGRPFFFFFSLFFLEKYNLILFVIIISTSILIILIFNFVPIPFIEVFCFQFHPSIPI
jgi:hypothetical protein